jgi:hypothetical protein
LGIQKLQEEVEKAVSEVKGKQRNVVLKEKGERKWLNLQRIKGFQRQICI